MPHLARLRTTHHTRESHAGGEEAAALDRECAGPSLAGQMATIVTVPITSITDISSENKLQKIGICVLATGLDSLLASIPNRQYSYHRVRTIDIMIHSHLLIQEKKGFGFS